MRFLGFIFSILFLQTLHAQQAMVSVTRMNVLYVGIENPVSVVVESTSCKNLKVKISSGKINGNGCCYTIIPDSIGRLSLNVRDSKNKDLGTFSFRIKRVPNPDIFIRPYYDKKIKSGRCSSGPYPMILAYLQEFDFDVRFSIIDFDVSLFHDKSFVGKEHNEGYDFQKNINELLMKGVNGDVLIFDIKVLCPGNEVRFFKKEITVERTDL